MQNIEINIHGFRFIEIETGYVAKPNRTAINRVPLSALIISIIMGKWAKPDLLDLENDLLNNSMKSISSQLINIIPKKLYTRNKEKLSECF